VLYSNFIINWQLSYQIYLSIFLNSSSFTVKKPLPMIYREPWRINHSTTHSQQKRKCGTSGQCSIFITIIKLRNFKLSTDPLVNRQEYRLLHSGNTFIMSSIGFYFKRVKCVSTMRSSITFLGVSRGLSTGMSVGVENNENSLLID
jgi:hypothetical protein